MALILDIAIIPLAVYGFHKKSPHYRRWGQGICDKIFLADGREGESHRKQRISAVLSAITCIFCGHRLSVPILNY